MKDVKKTRQSTRAELADNNAETSKVVNSVPTLEKRTNQIKKSPSKAAKKRKKNAPVDTNNEEALIDQAIEIKLQECAKRNNIAPIEMKKLLKKIVGNDHVLALVKLQEEAELATEYSNCEGSSSADSSSASIEHKTIDDLMKTPKLTRAKFRELNQNPLEIPSLNDTDPEPEVVALISEDLKSDDEDDEYEPREEDFVSEDDLNTTTSDLDSQPRTPMTPFTAVDHDSPIKQLTTMPPRFTSDGLFKVPRERNDSCVSQQEEIIATRTRSKLCLEETAIETIESTFIPPDVTSDMYNFDAEIDSAWMEFLNEFTKPLNSTIGHEEDDEADPEYVAAEKIPMDAEELRDANISKKELSDLVAELFDGLVKEGVIIDDDISVVDVSSKKNTDKFQSPMKKKTKNIDQQQQPTTSYDNNYQNNMFNTDFTNTTTATMNQSFQPNFMSTPQQQPSKTGVRFAPNVVENTQSHLQNQNYPNYQQPIPISMPNNFYTYAEYQPNPSIIVPQPQQQQQQLLNATQSISPFMNLNSPQHRTLIAYPVAAATTPCYQITQISPSTLAQGSYLALTNPQPGQPILAQIRNQAPVAYIDLTQSAATRKKTKYIVNPDIFEMWRGDAHNSANKYYKTLYQNKYNELPNEPDSIEENYPNIEGFTVAQRQIFDQQMRIHVQLLAQNFLQTYSHPEFWKLSEPAKSMAKELENSCKDNERSAFNSWNLKSAVELIEDWETELSEETEENSAMMEFIHNQIRRSKTRACLVSSRIIRFPPRMMKRLLKSTVFMYPEFIPRLPFVNKYSNTTYHEFCPIESHILAYGLEKYLPEVEAEVNARPEVYKKYSQVKLACIKISENIMLGKTPQRIYEYYKAQLNDEHYNPIKYYNERKMAPKFQHNLIPINLECVEPPQKRLPDLPMVWKEFGTTLQLTENKIKSESTRASRKLSTKVNELNWSKERIDRQKQRESKQDTTINQSNDDNNNNNNNTTPPNVIIHLNYIFDNSILNSQNNATVNPQFQETENNYYSELPAIEVAEGTNSIINSPKIERKRSTSSTDYTTICTKIHDRLNLSEHNSDSLSDRDHNNSEHPKITNTNYQRNQQVVVALKSNQNNDDIIVLTNDTIEKGQKLLTDFYQIDPNYDKFVIPKVIDRNSGWTDIDQITKKSKKKKTHHKSKKFSYNLPKYILIDKKSRKLAKNARKRKRLENKLKNLLFRYWAYLYKIYKRYSNIYLKGVFVNFKALELYTNFLICRKMNCKKSTKLSAGDDLNNTTAGKKTKIIDDEAAKLKKANRLSESLRQMLLPENKDEANKKDAIYAYNFYEKVEQAFTNSSKPHKFKKFQQILKEFDPQKNKVADLYYKLENLFLPNHPELAEVFLTFLLPSEAVQVGKFFEHFLITNMGTFINKLNVYFSKQPAQIRKIYSSFNDMADDPDLNMEKIKFKILPLLKGNQFLIDWFTQIFPDERPPESLLSVSENVCLKEVESQQEGIICETIPTKDLIDDTNENQPCQLRYINGRLFYGSRILLPAKLAFMAKNLTKLDEINNDANTKSNKNIGCVHGIRELAEKRLKSNNLDNNTHSSCDENDKSEDEDRKDERCSYQICDEAEFRMHATRLNPSLYGSEGCSSSFYKSKSICEESGKTSPKKQTNRTSINSYQYAQHSTPKDNTKRKSPKKNLTKSPNAGIKRSPPVSDSLNSSNAVQTAKRLKACTTSSSTEDENAGNFTELNRMKKKTSKNVKTLSSSTVRSVSSPEPSTSAPVATEIIEKITNEPIVVPSPWTRDEDKIILEEVKNGQVGTAAELLQRLAFKLTGRGESEILIRHQFLMELLHRLQKKKETG